MNSRVTMGLSVLVSLFIGLIGGYVIASTEAQDQLATTFAAFHPLRLPEEHGSLVHPLFAYETPEATSLNEYHQLKQTLIDEIETYSRSNPVTRASVYYRNLATGSWIGINEKDYFYPASLLKVPVMIAYFKQAESHPELLREKVVYTPIQGSPFDMKSNLRSGTRYTVQDLIQKMIIDSDNGATYTLIDHLDPVVLNEVYSDLGIEHPAEETSTYQISTRMYGLFFRILYNSTYLSPSFSKQALTLLSKTTYESGISAPLPATTTVAHKYGEHVVADDASAVKGIELHDCGIVYNEKGDYLLCIMTSAQTLTSAEGLIQRISKVVYDTVTP